MSTVQPIDQHGLVLQVPEDADLRATLKDGPYFYAELPGDVVGSRVRLIHRVSEVGTVFVFFTWAAGAGGELSPPLGLRGDGYETVNVR